MDKQVLKYTAAIAAILLAGATTGCNRAPTEVSANTDPAKMARQPLEPITGHSALNQMYRPVRQWAADALPLSLAAEEIPDLKNENGKAAKWTGVFVSASRREARTVFFSAADYGGLQRGITVAGTQPWSGATPKSRPFDPTRLFVDSDQAIKTASEKAASWVKAHPGKKPALFLGGGTRNPDPVWVIMWGDSKSGYLAYIDGASGKIMPSR